MTRAAATPDSNTTEPTHRYLTAVLWGLLLVTYGLVVAYVTPIDRPVWSIKALLVLFLLLPPPICFLLVRTYTQMIEDERFNTLRDAWTRCVEEFASSEEHRDAIQRLQNDPRADKEEAKTALCLDAMRDFVLRRFATLADLFAAVRDGMDTNQAIRRMARAEIRMAGLNVEAYNLPVLAFSFAYLAGLVLVLPFFESPLDQPLPLGPISLTKEIQVPLMVFQIGFIGGSAYAAFDLISRFLSRDIAPRFFLVAGIRLILGPLGACMLYLLAPDGITIPATNLGLPGRDSRWAAVFYLVAGGFPFALLRTQAQDLLSRLEFFKDRITAGRRSTSLVEGVTVFIAQRLSEEGIEVIQHLAFCDPADVARRTRYAEATVMDWKDQAILYLLTGDCAVPGAHAKEGKEQTKVLFDVLDERAGTRTMSGLIRRLWTVNVADAQGDLNRRVAGFQVRVDIEAFFRELGLLDQGEEVERKQRVEELIFLFARLCEDGLAIEPGLRRIRRAQPSPRGVRLEALPQTAS